MRTTMKAIKQSTQNIKTKRKRAPRSFVAALLPAPEQRNTHISHRSGHKCTTLRAACETFAWKTANVGRHTVGCQLPFCLSKWRNQITLLEHTTLSVVAERWKHWWPPEDERFSKLPCRIVRVFYKKFLLRTFRLLKRCSNAAQKLFKREKHKFTWKKTKHPGQEHGRVHHGRVLKINAQQNDRLLSTNAMKSSDKRSDGDHKQMRKGLSN